MEKWVDVLRPGYLGKHRDAKYEEWNTTYGENKWRLVWRVQKMNLDFYGVCMLYEDAYCKYLESHPGVLGRLITDASDVYDDDLSNIASGIDYRKQESIRTHIQDIAIRRSLIRLGLWFEGKEPMRIRQEKGTHPLSTILSPGRVPFHQKEWIIKPEIKGWWHKWTVESFYQSNRYLQEKRDI